MIARVTTHRIGEPIARRHRASRTRCFPVALGILLASACTGDSGDRSDLLSDLPTWQVTRALEIGNEKDPNYALVPVQGLAISPRGEILVTQPQEGTIRVFDADGSFLRRIGRTGDGPGEFMRVAHVGVLHDRIWVTDSRQTLFIHFFDLEGRPLDRIQVPSPSPLPPYVLATRALPLTDGGILVPAATFGDILYEEHEQPMAPCGSRSKDVTRRGGRDETRWLHLNAELEPVALIELPLQFRVFVAEGDDLWGVELDELSVPRVVRFRVER